MFKRITILLAVLIFPLVAQAGTETKTVKLSDWCTATMPAVIHPGETIQVTLAITGVTALSKICSHLHYKRTNGIGGGVYSGAQPQDISGDGSYIFKYKIEPKEGLESVNLVIFLSPTGGWKDNTAVNRGPDIFLDTAVVRKSAETVNTQTPPPQENIVLSDSPLPLLDFAARRSDWCTVSLLNKPKVGGTVRAAVHYRLGQTKGPLNVFACWNDIFNVDRGFLADSANAVTEVTGEGDAVFDIKLPGKSGLKTAYIQVIIGGKVFRSELFLVYDEKDPVKPPMDAAWNRTADGGWSWDAAHAKVNPTGDMEWAQTPFVLRKGNIVRYIDFENGSDNNSGETPETPWKHHPWDVNATVRAKAEHSADTYIFKRGVVYRGTLDAAQSGTEDNPIRLTSDPSWGSGEASIYGSERLEGAWTRINEGELPNVKDPEKIWRKDVGAKFVSRDFWEVRDGRIIRMELARFPNWKFSNPDDIRAEWSAWESVNANANPKSRTGKDRRLKVFPQGSLAGAVIWSECYTIGLQPLRMKVLDNANDEIVFEKPGWEALPVAGRHYFIENAAVLLDEPGEYWHDSKSGRLYLRLNDDRDPNTSVIEAACRENMIALADKKHIDISGLTFRFGNTSPYTDFLSGNSRLPGSVLISGGCDDIRIHHCNFEHVVTAVLSVTASPGALQDRIAIEDNDVCDAAVGAFHLNDNYRFNRSSAAQPSQIFRVKVMRNRITRAGLRLQPNDHLNLAINIDPPRLCEVAGNIIRDSGGPGIRVASGKQDAATDLRDVPLVRTLIHHNKVVNALHYIQDYGAIASWNLGPVYIYDNISENPLGHHARNPAGVINPYMWRQDGFAYYLDGGFKNYMFNNIAWGKSNNLKGPLCNTGGLFDLLGQNNVFFNNTFYRFGAAITRPAPMYRSLMQGDIIDQQCVYAGNLCVDMSDMFIDLDWCGAAPPNLQKKIIDYSAVFFTRNVFSGSPRIFGKTEDISRDQQSRLQVPSGALASANTQDAVMNGTTQSEAPGGYRNQQTLADFNAAMRARKAPCPDIGVMYAGNPLIDPERHDMRPKPEAKILTGMGARCFVPWALYGVAGEWNFHPFAEGGNPVVVGENMYFTEEYYVRTQYHLVPKNSLVCKGITHGDFTNGILDDWTADTLRFNGKDAYCILSDSEIKRSMDYKVGNGPVVHYDGSKRKSLDMDVNNFLIEIVFKTDQEKSAGSIMLEKAADAGYRLRVDEKGCLALDIVSPSGVFTCISSRVVNDGVWHHAIAEVDRSSANGMRMYLDGVEIKSSVSGVWPEQNASLANTSDFFVGRGTHGNYFSGVIDFLRVSRGTLADAYTSIEELYAWEFKGPMLRDFAGVASTSGKRCAGAIDGSGK